MNDEAQHNMAQSRYELAVDGALAIASYRLADGVATFHHTETPAALQGRGIASKLVHAALTDARARGWKIRATCSFVDAYLDRHPEFTEA